ncbi:unnamed protein product [Choristocarpus tenellus]
MLMRTFLTRRLTNVLLPVSRMSHDARCISDRGQLRVDERIISPFLFFLAASGGVVAMCSCSPSQPSPTTGGRGQEDESLVAIAHGIRTSLVPPHLSLFRVVCILQYQDSKSGVHLITGKSAGDDTA